MGYVRFFFIAVILFGFAPCSAFEDSMFWWKPSTGANFGDELSRVVVERILRRRVNHRNIDSPRRLLLAAGSILHFAKEGDVIWGSGFREPREPENKFCHLDIRAVRGPKTRDLFLKMGASCPAVYGDPAVLMGRIFPKYKKLKKIYDYIIIPNIGEINLFTPYKNIVLPTASWHKVVKKICQSRLVISSSLHGLIVADAYGIPARLLKMTWIEPLFKYQDYYESTGRPNFKYAISVQDALRMGGEPPSCLDINPLLKAFPWDYFNGK
jgi:pyruvyltransferase